MRKAFLLILLGSIVFASDEVLATKIYSSIAKELSKKAEPRFYLHGDIKHLTGNKSISISYNCSDADIIVLNTLNKLPQNCKKKLLFTESYRVYNQNKSIIGAFFWQKGRPNIVFRESVLADMNITLKPSFSKYIE